MSLQEKIDASVRETLQRMGTDGAWRCYTGNCQAELVTTLAESLGGNYAGLACSGSAALEMLLRARQLEATDEVMLSGYDYPGNFAAIERVGARPVLVDIEAQGWRLSLEMLESVYSPRCKVLIASHLHGQLQPIEALQSWCQANGILLIQDACQALGATIGNQKLAAWGDATLISFGGTKVISAGRGGAWLTNNGSLAQHARRAAGVGSGAYEISELQAALVLAQLPYLAEVTEHCRGYFSSLHASITKVQPELFAPWWSDRQQSAFYQAGWLLPAGMRQEDLESMLRDASEPFASFGSGFAGFHRRSMRRARVDRPLVNVESVVDRTITLHHRSAMVRHPL